MDVKELLKMLQGEDAEAGVDGNDGAGVQSEDETAATGDGSQNETGSEDANAKIAELLESLNARSEALDETNARVEKLEKVLTQLLTKGAATDTPEKSRNEPEEYVSLKELDFTTPPPKIDDGK